MKKMIVLFMVCFLNLIQITKAATLNVRPAGGVGFYKTIQAAINAASNGDVISVANGTYTAINLSVAGGTPKSLTIKSLSGSSRTFINAAGTTGITIDNPVLSIRPVVGIEIKGFTVQNGVGSSYNVNAYGPPAAPSFNSAGGAAYISAVDGVTFHDVIFLNNSAVYGGAVFSHWSKNINFEKCIFKGNSATVGGAFNAISSSPYNQNFKNCLMVANTASFWGGAIDCNYSSIVNLDNCTLTNNTCPSSGGAAIELNNAGIVNAKNSIFWNNSTIPYHNTGGSAVQFNTQNCDVHTANSVTYPFLSQLNNIDQNPLFVNSASDFHLQPSSPAINKGQVLSTVLDDLDNNCRPVNTLYDMGCYEKCLPPLGLTATNFGMVTLNWTPEPCAKSYNIQYRTKAVGGAWSAWVTISTLLPPPFTGIPFTSKTSYQWRIQTLCTKGTSTYSTVQSFVTPLKAPAGNDDFNEAHERGSSKDANIKISALNDEKIQLYPNPATDLLHADVLLDETINNSQILIFDLAGKVLSQKDLTGGYNKVEFDLSEMPNGMYIYKVMSDKNILKTGKFVVQK